MATQVIMPKFGMTQESATILRWLCREGDSVELGDPLLEVETDKVIMEVEAPASGILRGIRVGEKETVPVAQVIALIVQPGETLPEGAAMAGPSPSASQERLQPPADARPTAPLLHRPRATPAARCLARDHQVSLALVQGTGVHGRIQAADVQLALAAIGNRPAADGASAYQPPPLQPAGAPAEGQVVPLEGMRRIIADRMTQSYQTAPHIALTIEADMTGEQQVRDVLNAEAEKTGASHITVTAILVRVCAWALQRHRRVNASLRDGAIHFHSQTNIGVAVALEDGLIVPVLHGVERLSIGQIARGLDDLGQRARQGKLRPDDVEGGTFTISNLGMFGIKHFSAIINPPEIAILAVGRITDRPIAAKERGDHRLAFHPMMEMTLSVDHRVLDGAAAARFLADLVVALEQPYVLL